MPITEIKRHMKARIEDTLYTIVGRVDRETLHLVADQSGDSLELTFDDLCDSVGNGKAELIIDLMGVDDERKRASIGENLKKDINLLTGKVKKDFERRLSYISALDEACLRGFTPEAVNPVLGSCAARIGDKRTPHFSTAYRWYDQYRKASYDVRALIPNYSKRGNRKARVDSLVERIIASEIDRKFLTQERIRASDLAGAIYLAIKRHNEVSNEDEKLRFPSEKAIRRRIAKITPDVYTLRREGKRSAFLKFHPWMPGVKVTSPLERVEMDHAKLDLFVVDEKDRLPIGRPWLTMAIDVYTGIPLGYHLTFDEPSWLSILRCLRHAALPKMHEPNGLSKNRWNAYGMPKTIVVDNGKDFHSTKFQDAGQRLGFHIQHAQARAPWLKGTVERFFGTINRSMLSGLPGYVQARLVKDDEFDPRKNGVVDLKTLKEIIHWWITDYYSQLVKRRGTLTPAQLWDQSIKNSPARFYFSNKSDLDFALLSSDTRVAQKYGVEIHSLLYNSPALAHMRERIGEKEKVEVRYDPENVGYIVVNHEKAGPIVVPAVEPDYAEGLSLWQHERILAYWRREAKVEEKKTLLAAKAEIIEYARKVYTENRRIRGRTRIHRLLGDYATIPAVPAASASDQNPHVEKSGEVDNGTIYKQNTAPLIAEERKKELDERLGVEGDWGVYE